MKLPSSHSDSADFRWWHGGVLLVVALWLAVFVWGCALSTYYAQQAQDKAVRDRGVVVREWLDGCWVTRVYVDGRCVYDDD